MANGDDGGAAASSWHSMGYGNDAGSTNVLVGGGDKHNNSNNFPPFETRTTTTKSSIVNHPDADRLLPSSETYGRLPTAGYTEKNSSYSSCTEEREVTRNRSRVDTTSATDINNLNLSLRYGTTSTGQQQQQQNSNHGNHLFLTSDSTRTTETSSSAHPELSHHPLYNNSNNINLHNPAAATSSSDLHLDNNNSSSNNPFATTNNSSSLINLSINRTDQNSPTFAPSGSRDRDAFWNLQSSDSTNARLIPDQQAQRPSSTITTQSSQTQQHSNSISQNQNFALSSTPQQSNLSKSINAISNTSATTIPSLQLSSSMGHNTHLHQDNNAASWAIEQSFVDSNHSNGSNSVKMDDRSTTPEGKNRDGDDSTVQSTAVLSVGGQDVGDRLSPDSSPRLNPTNAHLLSGQPATAIFGTPSTVSTTPSTEDADSLDKIGLKLDPSHNTIIEPFTLHRRAPSWDRSPNQRQLYADTEISASMQPHQRSLANDNTNKYWDQQQQQGLQQHHPVAQTYGHQQQQQQQLWGASQQQPPPQSRVASFRHEEKHDSNRGAAASYHHPPQQYARLPPHHQQQQQQHGSQEQQRWIQQQQQAHPQQQQYPGEQARVGSHHMQQQHSDALRAANLNNQSYNHNPYHPSVQRKPGYPPQHPMQPSQSPMRAAQVRPPRAQQAGASPHRQQQQAGGGGPVNAGQPPTVGGGGGGGSSRSSSEILKTLLRKKACLYEPDTSRAVALVTWLVGRELALQHGYFSRQQLQAGVHACVAEKIEAGTITRTKVNRCMQIILNSCFHYIIPRPDGTEEKGHTFRVLFADEVSDDNDLLRLLPAPWNGLSVNRDIVLKASEAELEGKPEPRSNHASPKGSPVLKPVDHRSPVREHHHDGGENDSKRAVLLCFNENVRAAEDVFRCHNEFIRDSAHSSNLQLTAQEWRIFFGKEAASAPHIWGNVGIPVVAVDSPTGGGRKVDLLGQMIPEEAGKFRTTWCAKRYDHDHEFCGMAHVEVNGGWLRRDPNVRWYKDEACPHLVKVADKRASSSSAFLINECSFGINCEFVHSREEMIYHPHQYKSAVCGSIIRGGACRFGDICHQHHPGDSARPTGKKSSSRHGRSNAQSGNNAKNSGALPVGAPILYASPAPASSFEKHLLMPGLQNLYRRQCTVVRAYLRNPKCRCCYSYFGDDAGIGEEQGPRSNPKRPGLPPSQQRM